MSYHHYNALHVPVRDCQNRIIAERTRDAALRECEKLIQNIVVQFPTLGSSKLSSWLRLLKAFDYERFDHDAWLALQTWIGELLDPPAFSAEPPGRLRSLIRREEREWFGGEPPLLDELMQRIRVSILIIEDTQSESENILAKLTNEYRAHGASELFELRFTAFPYPTRGDNSFVGMLTTREKFLDELTSLLTCQNRSLGDQSEFIQATLIDYDLAMDNGRLTGHDVAKVIRAKRPTIDLHLLTGLNFEQVFKEPSGIKFGRLFSKGTLDKGGSTDIIDTVLQNLRRKYETPFWSAVREVARRPMITCHTLPLAFGRSLRSSRTLGDLNEFFSENFFRAETSATLAPLDSLLHPAGTLKRAQTRAAHAFGADRTLFVTNGTSTANKIVLQAVLRSGAVVLVDRNCHISHHYGLALARARPVYLEPYYLAEYGIAGAIPIGEIAKRTREVLETTKQPPAAILLTNCTFDGICVKPERVIRCVFKVLTEWRNGDEDAAYKDLARTVFLFDEAWFAAARFSPELIEYTAMAAVQRLREERRFVTSLRVYVTQSTHKSLSAVRQGSMIHISDGTLLDSDDASVAVAMERRLDQAFHAHTSTSPSATILSSLDVARRQVELEGTYLTLEAKSHGEELRGSIKWLNQINGDSGVRALRADQLMHSSLIDASDFTLDPTRVTVLFPPGTTGAEVKKRLFDEYNIQINKYSHSTVLLNMTIGTSYADVWSIAQALWEIGQGAKASWARMGCQGLKETAKKQLPPFSGFYKPARETDSYLAFHFNNEGELPIRLVSLKECLSDGKEYVCATFITPYPPGYPVLLPGQIMTHEIVEFLQTMNIDEIHGAERKDGTMYIPTFELPSN